MHPSPPPGLAEGDDHRRQLAQREVADFVRRCPGVRAHPYFVEGDATLMECESIFMFDLRNTYPRRHRVPAFLELDLLGDPFDTFVPRDFLRHLQFGREPQRWALKGTATSSSSRRSSRFRTRWCSAAPGPGGADRFPRPRSWRAVGVTGSGPIRARGPGLMDGMRAGLTAAMADPSIDAYNVVHLHYGDLTGDPLGQLRAVRTFLHAVHAGIRGHGAGLDGRPVPPERSVRQLHDLETLGLDADEVHSSFAPTRPLRHRHGDHR
jgi:hypothetical protein